MTGPVRWLTVFVDLPLSDVQPGADFWAQATGCDLSEWRGDHDQFATLLPAGDHDPHLRVQGLEVAAPRVHIDLHVEDIDAMAQLAQRLGAAEVLDAGYRVMRSPGGFEFCLVPYQGEHRPSRVDQLCIDVPAPLFDTESRFWADLTGLGLEPSVLGEFVALEHRSGMPIRLLFQRLGVDDQRSAVHAHLDVSAGNDRKAVAVYHVDLGATIVSQHEWWIVMRDPVGQTYCVTRRDPQP